MDDPIPLRLPLHRTEVRVDRRLLEAKRFEVRNGGDLLANVTILITNVPKN